MCFCIVVQKNERNGGNEGLGHVARHVSSLGVLHERDESESFALSFSQNTFFAFLVFCFFSYTHTAHLRMMYRGGGGGVSGVGGGGGLVYKKTL